MADKDDGDWWDQLSKSWWGCIILGGILNAIAMFYYIHITHIEEKGGGRVLWIVAIIYNWAGKIGAVLLFAVPGAIFVLVGIWKLLSGGEDTE